MALGRPKAELVVTATEREVLEQWARRPKTAQALAQRARIVLACATGAANTAVGARVRVTPQMVGKWRARFVSRRLEGLLDEPRPGTPRRITDTQVEAVVRDTLEATPRDATHWSTRAMAARSGLSQTTIRRIWHAFALQPHRSETFKLSQDPLFIDKVRDIVGLYRPLLQLGHVVSGHTLKHLAAAAGGLVLCRTLAARTLAPREAHSGRQGAAAIGGMP